VPDSPQFPLCAERKILVTGGLGALGRPCCAALGAAGASVVVNDVVPPDDVGALAGAAGYVGQDAATAEEADTVIAEAARIAGGLTDVVLLAGRVHSAPVLDQSLADVRAVFALNVERSFLTAQAAARWWIAHHSPGNLVFVGSWAADVAWPGIAPYAATKAALRSMTRSFARELATSSIRANILNPGIVQAGMALRQWDTEPDYRRRASRAIPLGYLQPVDSVASALVFLCSPMSSYMTGSTLQVDGGASLYPLDPEETST
jgi:NAD(P)-dependent dehydrogenase (short-subunit alcohol dehydrogenase family)